MANNSVKNAGYSKQETAARLRKTLSAAFNMKPTLLKDVPKKHGGSRSSANPQKQTKKPR